MNENINTVPDIKISVKQTFGIDSTLEVDAFSKKNEYVPEIDKNYKFDKDTTLAILSGFSFNKRVLVQGYHGTGKSTHIEQVDARLNWPCIRINLDSHISRIDLIGKDAITLKDERTDGEVTYIFDNESYKRYKDGNVISEDGWRFSKLGALRLFNGDVKLTWKIKIGKENLMVIKTKFQPIGKEYPFTYKQKKLFFDEIQ